MSKKREKVMAKSADKAYGAESRGSSTMMFDADKLKLITDKKHKFYDPRVELPLSEELVESIKRFGVQQDIKVWKDRDSGHVYVVDGTQRVKNTREANKRLVKEGMPVKQVPGVALKGTMEHAFAIKVLLNGGRQDPTPQDQAKLAERLLEMGYDEKMTAAILHVTPATFKNYRALLECSAPVRAKVDSGELPVTMAYRFSKLEPAEQKEKLALALKAAEGVKGKHRRGKKMRAATGEKKMRSKKEVVTMIETLTERFGSAARGTIDLLKWVLGEDPPVVGAMKSEDSVDSVSEHKVTNHAPTTAAS
jgi:ParB family transcriptional regulator, chromosome partitioning protein